MGVPKICSFSAYGQFVLVFLDLALEIFCFFSLKFLNLYLVDEKRLDVSYYIVFIDINLEQVSQF